ncbi:MAG TPA: hypothetical protein ENM98_05365 [Halothiobacillaceae bacterium]|nr:hypothetical protein [Halothiobacillaceae bacterium]
MRIGFLIGLVLLLPHTASAGVCNYPHRVVIADMQIAHPPNDLLHLGRAFSDRLAAELTEHGFQVTARVPATRDSSLEPAIGAWLRQSATYFINLRGEDFQLKGKRSHLEILPITFEKRGGQISYTLDQGSSASRLREGSHTISPAKYTPRHNPVDATEQGFWETEYGEHIRLVARDIADEIAAEITCRPLVGRVTKVNHRYGAQELYIDLGMADGLTNHAMFDVIRTGAPLASLGSHALTRREQPATHRPQYAPESLGAARVIYLHEQYAILRYSENYSISTGMQVLLRTAKP